MGIKPECVVIQEELEPREVELSVNDVANMIILLAEKTGYKFIGSKYEHSDQFASIGIESTGGE